MKVFRNVYTFVAIALLVQACSLRQSDAASTESGTGPKLGPGQTANVRPQSPPRTPEGTSLPTQGLVVVNHEMTGTPIPKSQPTASKANLVATTEVSSVPTATSDPLAQEAIDAVELELLSSTPDVNTILDQWASFDCEYVVRYFVPDYDWAGNQLQPELWVMHTHTDASIEVLDSQEVKYGSYQEVVLRGSTMTPMSEDVFQVSIDIWVHNLRNSDMTHAATILMDYRVKPTVP